eukprot:Protomagalhaensia_sp_Gyna_25__4879@NODE_512_length_3236_cov_146_664060_g401_i0_p2_GENE_NODE_512_length_3236_cov_146_664060_g401_i0NODE_512_length_3236_cov_146_664060_g401_i0_p2_ORF_typecomplete_len338_score41_55LRR_9/PF14580_6/3_7e15LRR_9/PF14580_6/1_5e11LRR_9/PF14580_6/0_02LRR_9/PF14580_6/9_6e21LRR_4/PF12799_7/0_019LRR_4/PF12799_7/8_1e10LRR_4/PF12799_7/2_3e10LRR_4/PF12799_7/4_8e08LRR_4/PF12799_7/1_8e05LRR_4/PF12799_7/44LRR_4/PF12799_7/2_4e07LRR_4/PF12799_7/1_1e05LRR_4/PF12799_7/15LRR_8/PF13855_
MQPNGSSDEGGSNTGLPSGSKEARHHEGSEQQEEGPLEYMRLGVDLNLTPGQSEIYYHLARIPRIENLDNCSDLKVLSLVSNLIERIEKLEECSNLERLELYQNRIKVIENIAHLRHLTDLDLSFNKIKKIQNLETLVKLKNLFLSSNRITQIEGLDTLIELEQLELGSNRIRTVENIQQLAKLKQLWLGKNRIVHMALPPLPSLINLSFQCNRLAEWNPALFAACPLLEEGYFSENQLPDPPEEILTWQRLRVLDLGKNKVKSLRVVSKLKNLTELWLNDNCVASLEEVDHLKNLALLETLYLERNPLQEQLGPGYRQAILTRLPQLTQLDALLVR